MQELIYNGNRGKHRILIFVVLLLQVLVSCDKDLGAFFFHESVDRRAEESGGLVPEYLVNYPDSVPLSFAVFSDIHITPSNDNLFDHIKNDIGQKGIRFFIVAGDLTDDGLQEEYELCRDDFLSMGIPWFVTIGNHDMYQKNSWELWKEFFGPSCYTVKINNLLRLIFLDSSTGTIGKYQFDWLEKELQEASEKYILVITHYPLYDDFIPSIWRLPSSEERYKMLYLLEKYHVYGYIAGHLHTFAHKEINGVQHFIVGSMYPHELDKGEHGYLLFTLSNSVLEWKHEIFP